ncbi:MAG: acetyl-CoA carboxylase, carboxyltransferase subunit beta [Helicobacteraceae bacterium]|jgi:acetyl-CoA carboxylase carboxyl transferase subunit beta|nr:acetyl-CoA carboxylase, carboxyltransferase subunit beta [Helicobacteraceae bacterium]
MSLGDLFKRARSGRPDPKEAPSHWIKCKKCQAIMYYKEVAAKQYVCPKCGLHMRISAQDRIEIIADAQTFVEFDASLKAVDPLSFGDKKSYIQRLEEGRVKTGRTSAAIAGECAIGGISAQIVVFDFDFMGGSLGSVEGEKIVRAVNRAIDRRHGLVIVSASGGARMQESTFSLMQMAKTSAACKRLAEHRLPFISVLTDPTFGGVSASFAFLGDVIIAEPGAMIGFAGARVIKQTIGADLPEGFQSAEFLLERGLIDMIVQREQLKQTIGDLLRFTTRSNAQPSIETPPPALL